MKTILVLSVLSVLSVPAQVGRFTVTPLEVTGVGNGTSFTIKTAIHLDTETGKAYFLSPLTTTNAATWTPIVFAYDPPPTNFTRPLKLVTNANTGKVTLEYADTNTTQTATR